MTEKTNENMNARTFDVVLIRVDDDDTLDIQMLSKACDLVDARDIRFVRRINASDGRTGVVGMTNAAVFGEVDNDTFRGKIASILDDEASRPTVTPTHDRICEIQGMLVLILGATRRETPTRASNGDDLLEQCYERFLGCMGADAPDDLPSIHEFQRTTYKDTRAMEAILSDEGQLTLLWARWMSENARTYRVELPVTLAANIEVLATDEREAERIVMDSLATKQNLRTVRRTLRHELHDTLRTFAASKAWPEVPYVETCQKSDEILVDMHLDGRDLRPR